MIEKYSFFDAEMGSDGTYDRTYSSEDIASYFSSFVGNGVYATPASSLMVLENNNSNSVLVSEGGAWINGYYYELTQGAKEVAISLGDAMYSRIDNVCVVLDMQKRMIEIKVVEGVPSANPKAPKPVRTANKYELVLAQITVDPASTQIPQKAIKDTRPDKSVCGFVTGVIDQIDTTGLFAQYNDAFTSWFESIQASLEGDVAANLAAQITSANERVEQLSKRVQPVELGGTGATLAADALHNLGINWGAEAAPAKGTPNTIYIQML